MKLNELFILLSVTALSLAGCSRLEEMPASPVSAWEKEGRIIFDVALSIPVDKSPATRAWDDSSPVISNIYVAVFGSNNYLNEFVKAIPLDENDEMNLNPDGSYNYEPVSVEGISVYKVRFGLTPTTSERYVHILANVPSESVPPDFGYVDEVLGKNLYSSDKQDGYWWYKAFTGSNKGISASSSSAFSDIRLVRNFARLSLVAATGSGIVVEGFELYNTPTRGSFAPYMGKELVEDEDTGEPTLRYYFYNGWETSSGDPEDYDDVSGAYEGYLMPGATPLYRPSYIASDFPDKDDSDAEIAAYAIAPKFTYEYPVDTANPTYVIAKLTKSGESESKFYRFDILDDDLNPSPLLRNYRYSLTLSEIKSDGYSTPAEAELHPSYVNLTFSKETEDIPEIASNGAFMETSYAEKVFTTGQQNVEFKYRYTADLSASPVVYSSGEVSGVSGDAGVSADWTVDSAGAGPEDGWYTVTYDVPDPSLQGSEEMESTFFVTAGADSKMIRRVVKIISMKKKQLTVNKWEKNATTYVETLQFTLPDNLRPSMFPLHFKFLPKDRITGEQNLTPQEQGLVPSYETTGTGSTFFFLMDYTYSDYTAEGGKTITLHFKSTKDFTPEIILSDLDGYFEELDLGGNFATGLSAKPIPKGTGEYSRTVFEFVATVMGDMTLTLQNLTAVESSSVTNGTLVNKGGGSYTFTPTNVGTQRIELQATTPASNGTVTLVSNDPSFVSPDPLTVTRYDTYMRSGSFVQSGDLPLGMGQSTTFSFDYIAMDFLPVTITPSGVDLYSADGSLLLCTAGNSYTYLPSAEGEQTFTIKSLTNFADAGTISINVDSMNNPTPLTVKRATSFTIPANALEITGASNFGTPMYWRNNRSGSTSNTAGQSNYFNVSSAGTGTNTGQIIIDISSFTKADNTPVYFMYRYYDQVFLFIGGYVYMFASATLADLLNASPASPVTLAFSE